MDRQNWTGAPKPRHCLLEGRYTRLDPLSPARHGQALFQSALRPGAEDRFRYLFDEPPVDQLSFTAWLETASTSHDPCSSPSSIERRDEPKGAKR